MRLLYCLYQRGGVFDNTATSIAAQTFFVAELEPERTGRGAATRCPFLCPVPSIQVYSSTADNLDVDAFAIRQHQLVSADTNNNSNINNNNNIWGRRP